MITQEPDDRDNSCNTPNQTPIDTLLSLEQQFSIRAMNADIDKMNLEQAKQGLKDLYALSLRKEAMYQKFIKDDFFR